MAKKKKGLPEIEVTKATHGDLVDQAREVLDIRSRIANLEIEEADLKKDIAETSVSIRESEQSKGNYIGIVKIVDEGMTPVQVQHKMTQPGLHVDEGESLEHHFGSSRPMLWQKEKVVVGITDPDALIAELRAKDQNPWDVLQVTVKKGMDAALLFSENVMKEEAYLPLEGFLNILNEIQHTLSAEAKEYLSKYLAKVLKPTVSLGHK